MVATKRLAVAPTSTVGGSTRFRSLELHSPQIIHAQIITAIRGNKTETALDLIKQIQPADIDRKDEHKRTLFVWACVFGRSQIVEALIGRGAEKSSTDPVLGKKLIDIVSNPQICMASKDEREKTRKLLEQITPKPI